jgi:hypothetical protein
MSQSMERRVSEGARARIRDFAQSGSLSRLTCIVHIGTMMTLVSSAQGVNRTANFQ